jgi:hypothetical protein
MPCAAWCRGRGPWCGACQGVFDGDAAGVGLDGDVGGLAGMREADLDALGADQDGAA